MSQKQLPSISEEKRNEIAEAMADGTCTTLDEVMEVFGLSMRDAVKLLNDTVFLSTVGDYTKAQNNLHFHTKSMPRLRRIADSDDDKVSIQAIKLIAQLSNNLKPSGGDVNVNISLEDRVKYIEAQEKQVGRKSLVGEGKEIRSLPSHLATPEEAFDIEEVPVVSNNLKYGED